MATSAFKSAFDIIEATPNELSSQEQMNREPRYLFFAGDEPNMPDPGGMMVQSPVIPGKTIWRCAVTPAISVPVKMRREEIPDGRLLDGTDNGKGIASMLLPCGPEVDALLADYGHPDRTQWQKRWGLVELEELRGMAPRDVAKMNLTTTFFPSWPDVPKTNREVIALVEAKNAELLAIIEKRNGTEREQLLLAIGTRMLAAVQQAQSYHTKLIQNGNMRVTYPDTNDSFKPGFDSKDELFALRSGVGLAVNSLRGNQSDAATQGLKDVLEAVMSKFQPQQQQSLDPQVIAAIVAATVQAMNGTEPKKEEAAPKTSVPVLKK